MKGKAVPDKAPVKDSQLVKPAAKVVVKKQSPPAKKTVAAPTGKSKLPAKKTVATKVVSKQPAKPPAKKAGAHKPVVKKKH